ncbi:MAG: hypothetical protein QXG10_03200 [Candidatus Hadarchaeales archaeon]
MSDSEVLHNHGRRISLMADEMYSLMQRLRAIERRVSVLEKSLSVFMNGLGPDDVSFEREGQCPARGQ